MKLNVLVKKLFPLRRDDRFLLLLYNGGQHALEAAEAFANLLENYDDREAKVEHIKEIEDLGDQVRHEVMRNLHRTFMTPIDREDIALLSEHIDDVIDAIEEAARFLLEYDVAGAYEGAGRPDSGFRQAPRRGSRQAASGRGQVSGNPAAFRRDKSA